MSDSESIILIVTVPSNLDSKSMNEKVAYSSPDATLHVSYQHMNARQAEHVKNVDEVGTAKRPLSSALLQSLIKERAKRRSEPYELG